MCLPVNSTWRAKHCDVLPGPWQGLDSRLISSITASFGHLRHGSCAIVVVIRVIGLGQTMTLQLAMQSRVVDSQCPSSRCFVAVTSLDGLR